MHLTVHQRPADLQRSLSAAGAPTAKAAIAGYSDKGSIQKILDSVGETELSGIGGDSVGRALEVYQGAIDKFIDASKSGNSEATQSAISAMQMYGDLVLLLGEKYNAVATILGKPTFDLAALENGRAVLEGVRRDLQCAARRYPPNQ